MNCESKGHFRKCRTTGQRSSSDFNDQTYTSNFFIINNKNSMGFNCLNSIPSLSQNYSGYEKLLTIKGMMSGDKSM